MITADHRKLLEILKSAEGEKMRLCDIDEIMGGPSRAITNRLRRLELIRRDYDAGGRVLYSLTQAGVFELEKAHV